jgi:glycine cleavage system protein P-like pyridoxal-binding family
MPTPTPVPATTRRRVSLAQAAKGTSPASAALLGRVLPSADKQRSEVAAFQSSL